MAAAVTVVAAPTTVAATVVRGGHLRHEQAVTGLVFAAIGRDAYTRASALWAGFRLAHLVEIESCLLRSFRPLM